MKQVSTELARTSFGCFSLSVHSGWGIRLASRDDNLSSCLDRDRKLGGTSFASKIQNFLAQLCDLYVLGPSDSPPSAHDPGDTAQACLCDWSQNLATYPVRHCGTDAPVVFEELGLQIHNVRLRLSLHLVAGGAACFHVRKNLGRTQKKKRLMVQ